MALLSVGRTAFAWHRSPRLSGEGQVLPKMLQGRGAAEKDVGVRAAEYPGLAQPLRNPGPLLSQVHAGMLPR